MIYPSQNCRRNNLMLFTITKIAARTALVPAMDQALFLVSLHASPPSLFRKELAEGRYSGSL